VRSIAVASGKGGTGKTTVAVNLARVMPGPVSVMDCDVEEPNVHLFLSTESRQTHSVGIPVPRIDTNKCTVCGECARFCEFNALGDMRSKIVVFNELCHGCGGCTRVCPENAITEVQRVIGEVDQGVSAQDIRVITGRLNVGEALSPPVIRAVRRHKAEGMVIVDAPPGTACPFAAAVRGSDLVVLVTEPTPFGIHDLGLAAETLDAMKLPFGVVINRSGEGDEGVEEVCRRHGVPLLARIPEDRRIAEAYSRGELVVDALPQYREEFLKLYRSITDMLNPNGDES